MLSTQATADTITLVFISEIRRLFIGRHQADQSELWICITEELLELEENDNSLLRRERIGFTTSLAVFRASRQMVAK